MLDRKPPFMLIAHPHLASVYRLPTNSFKTAWTRSAIVATSFKYQMLVKESVSSSTDTTYRCSIANKL